MMVMAYQLSVDHREFECMHQMELVDQCFRNQITCHKHLLIKSLNHVQLHARLLTLNQIQNCLAYHLRVDSNLLSN